MRVLAAALGSLIVAAGPAVGVRVIYVDDDAPNGGDGSKWGAAYDDLQVALADAGPGDQVWVAEGVYTPKLPNDGTATYLVPDGVTVYGGFRGGESLLTQRPGPLDHPSVLDGHNGTYNLVTIVNAEATLDGFVLVGAFADGVGDQRYGPGVLCRDADATLRNLLVTDCESDLRGGAVAARGSGQLILSGCTFRNCRAGSHGGAVYAEHAVYADGCEFDRNEGVRGGALAILAGELCTVEGCVFTDNTGTAGGGGAWVEMSGPGSAYFGGCEFVANDAGSSVQSGGGAISFAGAGDHIVLSSMFMGNSARGSGGAVYADLGSAVNGVRIENAFFCANTCTIAGGAVCDSGAGELTLINVTAASNQADGPSGGVYDIGGDLLVVNSILFDNADGTPGIRTNNFFYNMMLVDPTVDYCLIGGWDDPFATTGTSGDDPMLGDLAGPDGTFGTDDDDPSVLPGSPAIDAGHSLYPDPAVVADVEGSPRFADDTGTPDTGVSNGFAPVIDIGAAEFQGTTPNPCPADLDGNGVLNFDDLDAFIDAFLSGDLLADLDSNGTINIDDLDAFISSFLAGC